MLDLLKEKFQDIYRYITKTGKIREENIEEAVKKIKLALLEADVHYKVVKNFIENVKSKSLGEKVLKSVTPSQQFIKIVYDEIVHLFGNKEKIFPVNFPTNRVTSILLVGLNGSGKTTSCIKLAKRYVKFNPIVIAADTKRAAAIEQLIILGKKYNIPVFYNKDEKDAIKIIKSGLEFCEENNYNLAIIDSAGRMEVDDDLMKELQDINKNIKPDWSIFVGDATAGQNIINVLLKFKEFIKIDGVMLTKFDSDARGGASLSLKYITRLDIFFIGTGENVNDIELFEPEKIAKRILGMTDVISIVETAQEIIDKEEALKIEKKFRKEEFTLNDFLENLRRIQKGNYLSKIIELLPINLPKENLIDEKRFKHIEAIILSMTPKERDNIDIIDLSRKMRISKGSGRPIGEVTQLIEQFKKTKKMLKKFLKSGINYNNIDINSLMKLNF